MYIGYIGCQVKGFSSRRLGVEGGGHVVELPGLQPTQLCYQQLGLVHSFVELNGKHTDTGIEPGTPIFDLTAPAPLHQWCVPVKE